MADNPFLDKLNQINGVIFQTNDLASSTNRATYSMDDRTITISDVSREPNDLTETYNQDPGTLSVVNSEYQSGFMDGRDYIPPVFGLVSFSNILTLDRSDGTYQYVPAQYAVIGFSEDGLMLRFAGISGSDFTNASLQDLEGGITVLSDDGFGPDSFNFPVTFGYDPSIYTAPICFAEGTHIATPSGPVAIEALAEGDLVTTASGADRAIKWIGRLSTRPARHPRPWEVNPVRIKAGAFAPDLPQRDLLLSPGHAVHVDGILVPVGKLANGATILQEAVEQIRYFHIELETHDVVLAEGLPCESYLDDGNRATFANAGEHAALHGRVDPLSWDKACAPMIAQGPQIDAIQARLTERAAALGWEQSEEAGLCIVADGCAIAPIETVGDLYRFAIPAASDIVLRSACGALKDIRAERGDPRRLGVAVAALTIDGAAIDLDTAAFGKGFHPIEHDAQTHWRWTTGEGVLNIAGPAMIEVRVIMVAPSWRRTATELRVAA